MKKFLIQFVLCGFSFLAGAVAASIYITDKTACESEDIDADGIGDGTDINDDFMPGEINED